MRRLLPLLSGLFAVALLRAQNVGDLIISEVMALPDSVSIVDDYGRRLGWIELMNTSTGSVSYGGCFLTDDRTDLRKSQIHAWDRRTRLGPRQDEIFFASGDRADGTFYTGFTLAPGKTVYLVSNDGRTVIDSLFIPADLPEGKSVVKQATDLREQVFEVMTEPAEPSPRILNKDHDALTKGELMARKDPHGLILAIASILVVFAALALLWCLFTSLFSPRGVRKAVRSARKHIHLHPAPDAEAAAAIAMALDMEQDGDRYAAIALALHLYLEETVHDTESYALTYRTAPSPWSAKERNFRKLPQSL